MKIIRFDEIDSTNSFLHGYHEGDDVETVVAVAEYQTAGRGQGSNRWESERGKNLTFSVRTYPKGVAAREQYLLSMCIALAVRDTLSEYAEGMTVKWPNDIYWNDRKISGTLIETTMSGKQLRICIFGTGININQQQFRSDAPNPVSLWQIVGHDTDRDEVLQEVLRNLEQNLQLLAEGQAEQIHRRYMDCLYRRDGSYEYRDKDGPFMARIETVERDGHLVLRTDTNELRRYAFKEVTFLL